MTAPSPLIEIRNLQVRFRVGDGEVEAVRGVSLDIRRGEVLGVIGESGSGKTVSMTALLRLLPDNARVTADALTFAGEPVLAPSPAEFRAWRGGRLAMIFQNPTGAFNPAKTIGWHLDRIAKRRVEIGRAQQADPGDAVRWLSDVGIPKPDRVLRLYPHQLSGGMLQRALIAMVVALEPDVIVADEPTTNLDYLVERQILDLFRDLRARLSSAIVVITHDMAVAEELCDRIAVMYAGEVVETGAADAMFAEPLHPYTRGLVETAHELDRPAARLREIPGELPTAATRPQGCLFAPRCPHVHERCLPATPPMIEAREGRSVRCVLYG
ncbi:MAG TPA: ABC transporter ATP-binding protein [Microvirga sp.]|nr:ABC transporter ATP-binding protein [Microvirga sp.]